MKKFKRRFIESAIKNGHLTPLTVEEVKLYLSENKIDEMPEEFELSIDHKSQRKKYRNNLLNEDNLNYEENLAQAAREGKDIPDSIKKIMDNDRKESDTQD